MTEAEDELAAFGLWRDVHNNGHLGPRTAAAVPELPRLGEFLLLREVALAATGPRAPKPEYCAPILAALAGAFDAVWPLADGPPPRDRMVEFGAAVALLRLPDLAHHRPGVVAALTAAVAAQPDRLQCAIGLLILGEAGAAPREFLDDPRLAVRVCAALAPALATDDAATQVLIEAAKRPAAFDRAFGEPSGPGEGRLKVPWQWREMPHRVLLAALRERVTDVQ